MALGVVVALSGGACGIVVSSPSPSPIPPILGGNVGPIAFAYPSSWTVQIAGAPQHYRTVFGFVVSPPATASESCGPADSTGQGTCAELLSVPAGTVAVTMAGWGEPGCTRNAEKIVADDVASGWTPLTVGGQPAAYDNGAAAEAGFTRTWEIAGHMKGDCTVYEIKAQFGASATDLAADVDALVKTIQIRVPGL